MPDVLDPLRGLGSPPLTDPESIASLRGRTARRRRRQQLVLVPVLVAALVGVGALVAAVRDEGGSHGLQTVDDPNPSSTTAPTSTSTTVVPAADGNPLAGVRRVVSGPDGVRVLDPVANPPSRLVTDEPSSMAYGLGDDLVVAELGDRGVSPPGPVVVFDGTDRRELVGFPAAGGWVALLDARIVGGRPTALVTTAVGDSPEDHEVHLLTVDVTSGEETDLGIVGGWEDGVAAGQLLSDGDVVLQRSWIMGGNLERRSRDGTVVWRNDGLSVGRDDANRVMVVHDGVLLVLEQLDLARFEVRRFSLATGTEGEPTELTVSGEGVGRLDGLCSQVHSAPGGLLCLRTLEGGPLFVDLSTGRATALPEQHVIMTVWRD